MPRPDAPASKTQSKSMYHQSDGHSSNHERAYTKERVTVLLACERCETLRQDSNNMNGGNNSPLNTTAMAFIRTSSWTSVIFLFSAKAPTAQSSCKCNVCEQKVSDRRGDGSGGQGVYERCCVHLDSAHIFARSLTSLNQQGIFHRSQGHDIVREVLR